MANFLVCMLRNNICVESIMRDKLLFAMSLASSDVLRRIHHIQVPILAVIVQARATIPASL